MTLRELRATRRDSVLRLAAKHGAYNFRVFGSVARGQSDARSDVDFLVDLEVGRTISDLGGLLMDLNGSRLATDEHGFKGARDVEVGRSLIWREMADF